MTCTQKMLIILALTTPWIGLASASAYKTKDLFNAVKRNDAASIQEIVAKGIDVDTVDKKGRTALFFAAQKNKPLAAKALLDLSANPLYQTKKGTPLDVARRKSRAVFALIQDHFDELAEKEDPNRAALAGLRATGRFQEFLKGDTQKLFCTLLDFKSGRYTIQELERHFGSVLVGKTYGDSLIQPLHYEFEQRYQAGGKTTFEGKWVFGYPLKASTPYSRYKTRPDDFHEVADFRYVSGDTVIMRIPKAYRSYPMCGHSSIQYQMDQGNYVDALKRTLGNKTGSSNK